MPSMRRRSQRAPARHVPAAARRRRILTVLALTTLLATAVVGVGALADLPVPTWIVAVPGTGMVGYLALLAIMRPGAPPRRRAVEELPAQQTHAAQTDLAATDAVAGAPHAEPAVAGGAESIPAEVQAAERTWTPVPLPTPTYVTAPRARRSVRTIDLSNPGSWTASPEPAATPAAPAPRESEEHEDYPVEHRRAVGD